MVYQTCIITMSMVPQNEGCTAWPITRETLNINFIVLYPAFQNMFVFWQIYHNDIRPHHAMRMVVMCSFFKFWTIFIHGMSNMVIEIQALAQWSARHDFWGHSLFWVVWLRPSTPNTRQHHRYLKAFPSLESSSIWIANLNCWNTQLY